MSQGIKFSSNVFQSTCICSKEKTFKVLYIVLFMFVIGSVFQSVEGAKRESNHTELKGDKKSIRDGVKSPVNTNLTVVPRTYSSLKKFTKSLRKRNRKAKGRKSRKRPEDRKRENKQKQSWLAVASAVAHSAAAESNHQPIEDDTKPTKYHYYPYNQHLYLLPECATQQVCSAVYLRLNYSQPLCACPNFHEPCSVSTRTDDRHTIPLVTGTQSQVLTLVKTCEPTTEIRECRAPKDWSILALQNSRTGKAHYLVICRCPAPGYLEGPIAHSQPAYARVPGIRVYGMTCVRQPGRNGKDYTWMTKPKPDTTRVEKPSGPGPAFPWSRLKSFLRKFNLST